jgi:hypothetical protein
MKLRTRRTKEAQYTVRSIPEHIDRELRKRAREQNKSLNHVILEILEQATSPEPKKNRDLDKYAGTWVEDPAFDEAMKDFERIDEEMWK